MPGSTAVPGMGDRDRRLDSLAGVLIVLVVYGHVMLLVPGEGARAVELFIYLFHMPAFVWLSGYLTRMSRTWSVGRLVARLLFPFLVFQILHRVLIAHLTDNAFSLGFPGVSWTLWYLLALFVWRMAAILLARSPWSIAIAVLLALAAGAAPFIGYDYSLSRILGFLPFFVAGLFWKQEWLERLARWWWAGAALLLAAAAWAVAVVGEQSIRPFHMARSYDRLGLETVEGVVGRAVILAASAVLVLAVIALSYRHLPVLDSIGRGTLTVYLLHPIVLMPWYVAGDGIGVTGLAAAALGALGALGFAYLASRPVVATTLAPLTDFTWWSSRWRIGSPREREWTWR
ncbi:acyltransferase family protein [Demequina sp. NBRC 110051]|uniref:acyltransferase family protein n=1 Tax=Demequina sp. NBRC 110051 TaxID=1570340 RepID=UPI0009FD1495|nr:acyltransferase family protein [Demequina sp. NBRC 110051]